MRSSSAASALLPVVGTAVAPPAMGTPVDACAIDDDGCITCGDVAVPLTVVEVGQYDARCRDDAGREEMVATELVPRVTVGDRLLVHAKVALETISKGEDTTHALR